MKNIGLIIQCFGIGLSGLLIVGISINKIWPEGVPFEERKIINTQTMDKAIHR